MSIQSFWTHWPSQSVFFGNGNLSHHEQSVNMSSLKSTINMSHSKLSTSEITPYIVSGLVVRISLS